jgi:hypothetical protein
MSEQTGKDALEAMMFAGSGKNKGSSAAIAEYW